MQDKDTLMNLLTFKAVKEKVKRRGEERKRPEHMGRMSRWRTVLTSKKTLPTTVNAKLILRSSLSCMISG
jgi:hypothetical protein